jgi:hypothetical protein
LLLVAVSALVFPAASAQQPALSPAEYRAVVAGALADLAATPDQPDQQPNPAPPPGADAVSAAQAVQLPDGRSVVIVNPPLRAAQAADDAARARADLTALLAALDEAAAARPPPPDAAARLAAVLNRPELRAQEPGPLDRLTRPLREAWERLRREILVRLLQATRGQGENLALVAVGVLVLLAVGAMLAGAFGGSVVAAARAASGPTPDRPTAAATRARAQEAAAAGDYREAVHQLYLATLLHLDERGRLRFRPSLTNREHLTAGHVDPGLAPVLAPVIEGYDRLWYGGIPCTADDWARFRALAEPAWGTP